MTLTINQALSLSKPASASPPASHYPVPQVALPRTSAPRSGLSRYKPGSARQGAGLALLIEAALIAVAVLIFNNSSSIRQVLSEPVPIILLTEKLPPPPPEKNLPLPQIKNKLALPEPKVVLLPPEPVVTMPPAPLTQTQNTITEPPPPPPPPRLSGEVDPNAEYAAKVHAAVQAAVYYPPAAIAMRYSGRVRVEFHLRDGVPGQARVVVGSNIGMIDRAALESVQNAHYPAPPPEMRGSERVYQVWVEFTH